MTRLSSRRSCALAVLFACLSITTLMRARAEASENPQLPIYTIDTSYPVVTSTYPTLVTTAQELQQALNTATPGEEIRVAHGAQIVGHFVLPPQPASTQWVVIRSDDMPGLPALGTRVDPAVNGTSMPKIQGDQAGYPVFGTVSCVGGSLPAECLGRTGVSRGYRFVGLDISVNFSTGAVLEFGSMAATSADELPRDIAVDRCFVHGSDTANVVHGISLLGNWMSVTDSVVTNFHSTNAQAQAIWANGGGPYAINNNRLEGAGEGVIFGGEDSLIADLIPSDIEVRRNLVRKPVEWQAFSYNVANLFELKLARRIIIDQNIFENNWIQAQSGYAIVFTGRAQAGYNAACDPNSQAWWSVVEHVTFTNNVVRHSAGGVQFIGKDYRCESVYQSQGHDTLVSNHIRIANNLFYDIGGTWGGAQAWFVWAHGGDQVIVDHNTVLHTLGNGLYRDELPIATNVTITNNMLRRNDWGGINSAAGEGNGTLNTYFAPPCGAYSGCLVAKNVFAEPSQADQHSSLYPSGQYFPLQSAWEAEFVSASSDDYRLQCGSSYKGAGTDGLDVGADVTLIPGVPGSGSPNCGGGGGGGLPSPWTHGDIGAVGVGGSASYSTGTFSVAGSGADIWGASDAFHFTYQTVSGDVSIVARLQDEQNTNAFAKAGLMIRESTADNAAHVILDIKPDGGVEFMHRQAASGLTTVIASAYESTPGWLGLVRIGSQVTAYLSQDGVTWTALASTSVGFGNSTAVGLAVTSHDNTTTNTATFDNVSVSFPWSHADVGQVGQAGGFGYANGTFTVSGAGADIWGAADAFQIGYVQMSVEFSITAHLVSMQNTSAYAKAGLMFRENLAAGSPHVMIDVKPDGGVEFMTRTTTDGATTFVAGGAQSVPGWLRLTRVGTTVSGYVSSDGQTWTLIGSVNGISYTGVPYVGMIVNSHDVAVTNTSVFDNVSVSLP